MLVGLCPCWINFVSVFDRRVCQRDFALKETELIPFGSRFVRNIVTIRRLVATSCLCSISQGTYRGQENSLHTLSPSSTTVWLQMYFPCCTANGSFRLAINSTLCGLVGSHASFSSSRLYNNTASAYLFPNIQPRVQCRKEKKPTSIHPPNKQMTSSSESHTTMGVKHRK